MLDVGCAGHIPKPGSSYWLHGKLREKFPSITGIDVNEGNINKLKALGLDDLFVASAENFDLNRRFDTIVAGELIEHLANPGLFLQECSEHLKPQGRVVLTTPYAFSLLYIIYAFFKFPKTCENGEHCSWFCVETLTQIIQRYGYKVEHWEIIEDYELDNPSFLYRIFAGLMVSIGRVVIPGRLRKNNLLFVISLKD